MRPRPLVRREREKHADPKVEPIQQHVKQE